MTLFKSNFFIYAHKIKDENQVKVGKIIWEYGGTVRRAGFKIQE